MEQVVRSHVPSYRGRWMLESGTRWTIYTRICLTSCSWTVVSRLRCSSSMVTTVPLTRTITWTTEVHSPTSLSPDLFLTYLFSLSFSLSLSWLISYPLRSLSLSVSFQMSLTWRPLQPPFLAGLTVLTLRRTSTSSAAVKRCNNSHCPFSSLIRLAFSFHRVQSLSLCLRFSSLLSSFIGHATKHSQEQIHPHGQALHGQMRGIVRRLDQG